MPAGRAVLPAAWPQTPTPAPNLTLLQLTLRTGTVNATVLAWVLLDRGIEASVLDVTVFANGQNAVVRVRIVNEGEGRTKSESVSIFRSVYFTTNGAFSSYPVEVLPNCFSNRCLYLHFGTLE